MQLIKKNFVSYIGLLFLTTGLALATSAQEKDTVVVRFQDNGELLTNPGKGFMTFQRFEGDTANALQGCCGDFREDYPHAVLTDSDDNLINEDYPNTSMAYLRFYWRFLEPGKGEFRWDILDRALKTARERGQTVKLGVMSHGSPYDDKHDVPDWYREMVGEKREWELDSPVNGWMVDPEDPRYAKYFGGFVRKIGERYDNHPDLEAVDVRIVGAWGEGAGSDLLSQPTREALVDAYTDTFKETPLIMLLTDEETNKYGISQANVGWRADCMGDIGFWADEQDGWTHMYDYYPQGIINYGMKDAWKKGHVTLEICYNFPGWEDQGDFTKEEVEYIFEQGLKWKMSSFNAKSAPVPEKWQPMVDEWIKKMGYRFVPRRISYTKEVGPNRKLDFTSWWENKGVAPIYRQFPLALRLRNAEANTVLLTEADIREWMPGDNLYNDAVYIPDDLPPGEYQLELAMIYPINQLGIDHQPAIKLPIDARTEDGWYSLGKIEVTGR
ncbi:MAG: DUF4832 domain-containing protein [Balneolales bacterium]